MANNVEINLKARTTDFETGLKNANNMMDTFAQKGGNLGKSLDKSFGEINKAAKNNLDSLQKDLAAFNVKSDLKINFNLQHMDKAKESVKSLFDRISQGGASIAETTAALNRMNTELANINSHQTRGLFKDLGILSESSIEAMKLKTVNAFEEIKRAGTASPNDIIRANEAMVAELSRLDGLLVTNAEKENVKKIALVQEMLNAKLVAVKEAQIAEINMLEEATRLNQKFEYDKQRAAEKTAAIRIASLKEIAERERASYAAQGMATPGAANKLIGQPLAGSVFSNAIKAEMEAVVAAEKAATQKVLIETEAADARIRQINKLRAASVNAEVQSIIAAEKAAMVKTQIDGVAEKTERVSKGINGWSLASVAAIAKIQILYSLINNIMSTIGSIPRVTIDAIENYKTSIVTNAALITSMNSGVKDIGEAYKQNKVYAEAVEKVLVRMDTETSASYEQLQLMNRAYIQQGVYLDINNKKAIEGRRNTANALAVIAQATPNPNMQFGQEIRGLMTGTMKEGNALLKMLVGIDQDIVAKIERWKKAGTIDENIGKLLVGFAAAQGDIDSMWETVKSTMATIRDEVLRGGLAPAFHEIVLQMKEINKYADANKEKIQAFLRDGFQDIKTVAKFLWESRDAIKLMGEAALFAGFVTGIGKMIVAVVALKRELMAIEWFAKLAAISGGAAGIATGGAAVAAYGGYKVASQANQNQKFATDANLANKMTSGMSVFGNKKPLATAGNMAEFQAAFPMDGPELFALARTKGYISLMASNAAGGASDIYKLQMNVEAIKKLKENIGTIITPSGKGGKASGASTATGVADVTKYSRSNDLLLKNIEEYQQMMRDESQRWLEVTTENDRLQEIASNVFNISTMQAGDLKTNRYKVTPLSQYKLRTSDQYSIPQSSISQEQKERADATIGGINEGLNSKTAADNYDIYDSKLADLKKFHEERLKSIIKYSQMEGAVQAEANAAKLKNDQAYADSKRRLDIETAKTGFASLADSLGRIGSLLMEGNKEQFEAGKKMAISSATISMTLGAIQAYTSMTSIPKVGVVLGAIAAAAVVAAGMANIAKIESQSYEGREFGGPVTAGQSYIVGEKRPELFTPGVSGVITPYVPANGRGQSSVTQVNNFSMGVTDTVRSEIGRMAPMFKQLAVQAVQEAQRGGQLQAA